MTERNVSHGNKYEIFLFGEVRALSGFADEVTIFSPLQCTVAALWALASDVLLSKASQVGGDVAKDKLQQLLACSCFAINDTLIDNTDDTRMCEPTDDLAIIPPVTGG